MQNSAVMRFDSNSSWSILSSTEQSIKRKIEQCGTKLADWNVSIFRGILTGYNDAFIISGEVKDSLIAQDPKSAEIIRPILRGRDIKRYSYEFADLWIIATFPSRHYDIDDYPAVKKHLLSFGMERLEQTGRKHVVDGIEVKARKKTSNKWYETQDSISYWDDFSKQKIVFAETMRVHRTQGADRFPRFSFVEEGFFQDKTCFMITGNDLYYILAIINSSLMNYYIHKNVAVLDTGGFLMQKIYVDCFPVPRVHEETYEKLTELSKEIVKRRKTNTDSFDLEDQVDSIVYEIFCLTDKEIRFIQENI